MKITSIISKITYPLVITIIFMALFLLAATKFSIAGIKIMVVQSGSMEPALRVGTIVVAKPENSYQTGDIISFSSQQFSKASVTHRVTTIENQNGQTVYYTKGDANRTADQTLVRQENIIGKVWFSVPWLGFVVVAARKPYGLLVLIILPALLVIYEEVQNILKELKKQKEITKT